MKTWVSAKLPPTLPPPPPVRVRVGLRVNVRIKTGEQLSSGKIFLESKT